MYELAKRYTFDWKRIGDEDGRHIEYCITNICNRNCKSCSHLAPLAKRAEFVSIENFERDVKILARCLPETHTFWLTGGEPTLHLKYRELLKIAREIFNKAYIGIYTNGNTLKENEADTDFWRFTKENGIVWAVTTYEKGKEYFENLFSKHGCIKNLTIVQSGKYFSNLTNYAYNQPSTADKYDRCGWERCKINVRNGRIYNCPSAEFADLFNDYFGNRLKILEKDYLTIDESLTKERIEDFRGVTPFCGQCNREKRYRKFFKNAQSERNINEWSEFEPTK